MPTRRPASAPRSTASEHGRAALAAERAAFRYPVLRVTYRDPTAPLPSTGAPSPSCSAPGVYATTVTQPGAFRRYLLEQLEPLVDGIRRRDRGRRRATRRSPILMCSRAATSWPAAASTAAELARHLPVAELAAVGDEIADGLWRLRPGSRARWRCSTRPRRLFAAPPRALHRHRLAARAALGPAHQLPPLCRPVRPLGPASSCAADGRSRRLVLPGNVVIDAAIRRQRPRRASPPRLAPLPDARLSSASRRTARASRSSTSASGRRTPRPSPTTSRCCARIAG